MATGNSDHIIEAVDARGKSLGKRLGSILRGSLHGPSITTSKMYDEDTERPVSVFSSRPLKIAGPRVSPAPIKYGAGRFTGPVR